MAGSMIATVNILRIVSCIVHILAIQVLAADYYSYKVPQKNLRVLNQKEEFKKWPNNQVFFYLDTSYTVEEAQLIRLAMFRVMSDLQMCVSFLEVAPTAPQFKVKITPTKADNVTSATYCYTFPGLYEAGRLRGDKEQTMTVTRGPYGCLDGSLHRIMKYFTLLLGKRNEHQRADRDQYIQIKTSDIIPEMIEFGYRKYNKDEAFSVCNYDYCSITHNQPKDFALPSSQAEAFTVKNPPFFIPSLDRLSDCDCKELSASYNCDASLCLPLDCSAQTMPDAPDRRDPSESSPALTFTTVSSNPGVATSVTANRDATTICYSVPSVTSATKFSVVTTVNPTTTASAGVQPDSQTLPPAFSTTTTSCSISTEPLITKSSRSKNQLRVVDTNPNYLKWPRNKVPYYIDSNYNQEERKTIERTIKIVAKNMKDCIQFTEVPPTSSEFKVKITPFAQDGVTQEKQCYSYPGIYTKYMETQSEQSLVLARGPDGCLGGTHHNIFKYFAIILGKRTEHQRPDRDSHITILRDNIVPGMEFAYETYNWTLAKAYYPYDYCSVTHNQPDIFAKPGMQAFTVKDPPYRIPVLDQFSEIDCKELSEVYSCDAAKCEPLDCKTLVLTSTTSTSSTTTGTSTTAALSTTSMTSSSATTISENISSSSTTTSVTSVPGTSSSVLTSGSTPISGTSASTSPNTGSTSTQQSSLLTSNGTTVSSSTVTGSSSSSTGISIVTSSVAPPTGGTSGTSSVTLSSGGTASTLISPSSSTTSGTSTNSTSSGISTSSSPVTTSINSSTLSPTSLGVPSSQSTISSSTNLSTAGTPITTQNQNSVPCGANSGGSTLVLPLSVSSITQSGIQVCYRLPPITKVTSFSVHLSLSPLDLGYAGFSMAASTCPA